jgi:hypothetical protein
MGAPPGARVFCSGDRFQGALLLGPGVNGLGHDGEDVLDLFGQLELRSDRYMQGGICAAHADIFDSG